MQRLSSKRKHVLADVLNQRGRTDLEELTKPGGVSRAVSVFFNAMLQQLDSFLRIREHHETILRRELI